MSQYKRYAQTKTLSRDPLSKKLTGVCAGIARHIGLPRLAVRIAAVISFLYFPLAILIAYLAATVLLPEKVSSLSR